MYEVLSQGASKLPRVKAKSSYWLLCQFLFSKVVTLNIQIVVVLMPLEIQCHTLPHLKGLNSGMEP